MPLACRERKKFFTKVFNFSMEDEIPSVETVLPLKIFVKMFTSEIKKVKEKEPWRRCAHYFKTLTEQHVLQSQTI